MTPFHQKVFGFYFTSLCMVVLYRQPWYENKHMEQLRDEVNLKAINQTENKALKRYFHGSLLWLEVQHSTPSSYT